MGCDAATCVVVESSTLGSLLMACALQSACLIEPHYLAGLTNHLHHHAAAALRLCCRGSGVEAPALLLTHHQAGQTSMSEPEPPCLQHHLHTLQVCHEVSQEVSQPAQAERLSRKVYTPHGSVFKSQVLG